MKARVEYADRKRKDDGYEVELTTFEDFLALLDREGDLVVRDPFGRGAEPTLLEVTVYDDHIE